MSTAWRTVLRLRSRGSRGSVEVALIAVVAALVVGAVVGSGLAQTVLDTPDGLTWLPNDRGQVVQLNSATGEPETRLQAGGPADELVVTQGDNILIITNVRTGEYTIVDLSTLIVSGRRTGTAGAIEVLLSDGDIYLVDRALGLVERVDPVTATTIGRPWRAAAPLVDATVDRAANVWAIDERGQLVSLRWSDSESSLVEQQGRTITGAGPDAVLVAHELGVTVFGPEAGIVTQVGTGDDNTATTDRLSAPVRAAEFSPANLVPASSTNTSTVLLAHDGQVTEADVSTLGCAKPAQPASYRGLVYVPCLGARKVIVIDGSGRRADDDIATPAGGDPELVLDDGFLIINVRGADSGVLVEPTGKTRTIRTDDPSVQVHDPGARPSALPPGLGERTKPAKSNRPNPPDRPDQPSPSSNPIAPTGGPTTQPSDSPTGSPNPTETPDPGPPDPTGSPGPTESPEPTGDPGPTETAGPPLPTGTAEPTTEAPPTTEPPPTTPAPRPEDYTATGVTAEARSDSTIMVSWTAPAITPTSYRILRSDTGEEVVTSAGAATAAIVTGLPLGQPIGFIVEAVTPSGSYRSQPSNAVSAYGRPGGPTVSVQIVARSPATLTLRVTVGVVADGGSPVTAFDLAVSAGGGRTLTNVMGVPIGQNPYQFAATCSGFDDLCLSGGVVNATATLYNGAGAGPPTTTSASIDPPPSWAYKGSVMIVTVGGKCLDGDLGIRTCTGSPGQYWSIRNTGDIRNPAVGNQCLATNGGLHFTSDSCTSAEKRWGPAGNPNGAFPSGNLNQTIQNQSSRRCIFVNGDVGGEGVQFRDRGCQFNDQERFAFFTQTLPLSAAASARPASASGPPAADGPLGPATALLLLPVVAGLARGRQRRTQPRKDVRP